MIWLWISEKKKEAQIEKEWEDLGWMKDFKVKSRDIELCQEFQVFIRCTYQIFKNSQCFPMTKTFSAVFVSKQAIKTFKHPAKQSAEILKFSEVTKSWVQYLKSLAIYFCYHMLLSYMFFQIKHSSFLVALLFFVSISCVYVSNC